MKQLILISFSIMFIAASAQNRQTRDSIRVQKNLEAMNIVNKAFETGDTSRIDEVFAKDFIDHTEFGETGIDSLRKMIITMHKEFPDMKSEVIKEMADEEYVFALMKFSGISNGQMGMPKGPFQMQSVQVVRFKDGKISEHWEYVSMRDVMRMMPGVK
jgi:predicted SnoaL-like aldol condensation-catalyzing enzyme